MKAKNVSYKTILGAFMLLLSACTLLVIFWFRTVDAYIQTLDTNIHRLQIPSLTTHHYHLIDAINSNRQHFTENYNTDSNWPQLDIQESIIINMANSSLKGLPGKLLYSKLNDHIENTYRNDEQLFIYMGLPHVGGKFTLEELSKELFSKIISKLEVRELSLLLAAGFNANPNLKFSEIQRLQSEILGLWRKKELITNDTFEEALGWMPNYVLRRHKSFGYYHMIENAANRHGVDPVLLLALVQAESAGDPQAVSKVGALGLAQLMPSTASELRPDIQIPYQLYDPEINLELGAEYLASVISWSRDHFTHASEEEIVNFALAAYNAGWNRVLSANGIPNIRETRNYVQRVNWYYEQYSRVLNS